MDTVIQPNQTHQRALHNIAPFSGLIPPPQNISISEGSGDTYYSLELMRKHALEFAFEADKLAKEVFQPVLDEQGLKACVKEIRNFLYNHFQYRADADVEQIRSLARSVQDREKGIDCKDFATAASQILLNLHVNGQPVTHYFRKIKQPHQSPNLWTHVYIVVPQNQKTGSLNHGYYVIDPVPSYTHEPEFTQKHDLKMQHARLAGISAASPRQFEGYTLQEATTDENGVAILKIFKNGQQEILETDSPLPAAVECLSGLGCDCRPAFGSSLGEPVTATVMAIVAAIGALDSMGVGFHNEKGAVQARVKEMISENVLWLYSTEGGERKGAGFIDQFSREQLLEFIDRVNEFITYQQQLKEGYADCENGSSFAQGRGNCAMWRVHRREITAAKVLIVMAQNRLNEMDGKPPVGNTGGGGGSNQASFGQGVIDFFSNIFGGSNSQSTPSTTTGPSQGGNPINYGKVAGYTLGGAVVVYALYTFMKPEKETE